MLRGSEMTKLDSSDAKRSCDSVVILQFGENNYNLGNSQHFIAMSQRVPWPCRHAEQYF